jgi:hypothetical protein
MQMTKVSQLVDVQFILEAALSHALECALYVALDPEIRMDARIQLVELLSQWINILP